MTTFVVPGNILNAFQIPDLVLSPPEYSSNATDTEKEDVTVPHLTALPQHHLDLKNSPNHIYSSLTDTHQLPHYSVLGLPTSRPFSLYSSTSDKTTPFLPFPPEFNFLIFCLPYKLQWFLSSIAQDPLFIHGRWSSTVALFLSYRAGRGHELPRPHKK